MLGLCLLQGTVSALCLWAAVNLFQVVRARIEEEKLAREFPDYQAYRRQTRFILPGIY
jgi:protein-S-isoprenylcysteine O-methyltransferase Ste14